METDPFVAELFAAKFRERLAGVMAEAGDPEYSPADGWYSNVVGLVARLLGVDIDVFGGLLVGSGPQIGGRVSAIAEMLLRNAGFHTFARTARLSVDIESAIDNVCRRAAALTHRDNYSWLAKFAAARREELERK